MKQAIVALKVAFMIVIAVVIITTGEFTGLLNVEALSFILLGSLGLLLLSFSFTEMGHAFKHALVETTNTEGEKTKLRISAYFWESAARNMIMLGALRIITAFVISMHYRGGLQTFFKGTTVSFLTLVYGMVAAALCGVATVVIKKKMKVHNGPETPITNDKKLRIETFIGYALFILVLLWSIWPEYTLFLHWPSLLTVVGWALVLIVLMGKAASGHGVTLSFAVTGLIGTLIGFTRMFQGFSHANIQIISAGMTFSILSCLFAMLGMLLLGMPYEDHTVKAGKNGESRLLNGIAWYGIPMLSIALVIYFMVQATIPIVQK